ncbi:MAG: hypothetical protein D6786_08970 [Gammaproteobacteria bacterium]|nr:MAG: hypothetical protein D6786_08970 [Gammaproteobacteria bacterium]
MSQTSTIPGRLIPALILMLTAPMALADLSVRIYTFPVPGSHYGGHGYIAVPRVVPAYPSRHRHHGHHRHRYDEAYARHPYGYRYAHPNPYYRPYGHDHRAPGHYRPYAYRDGYGYRDRHHRGHHHRRHHHDRHEGYAHPPMGLGKSRR